jgi:GT2 family glycosyltransferase
MARLTVAIPTYNRRDLMDVVLPPVLAQEIDAALDVVVVDDGSTDGTAACVRERWPSVRVVEQENRGISAAMNRCLEEGVGSDYVALLNNDVEVAPGWAAAIVAALDADAHAGSATGKMLDYGVRDVLDGAGDEMRWSSGCWRRGHGERDRGQYDRQEYVLSACGGAAVYRRAAIDDVGGFDSDFVAYYEDVDWGLRAQLLGWRCVYVPSAVCFHMGSASTTSSERANDFAMLLRRNGFFLILKDFPLRAIVRHLPAIVRHHVGWFIDSVRSGLGMWHLRAFASALRTAPAMVRKRRAIQRARRVDVAYLDTVVTRGRS